MLDFGKWIVEVAVNGVKSGSFDRAWAATKELPEKEDIQADLQLPKADF